MRGAALFVRCNLCTNCSELTEAPSKNVSAVSHYNRLPDTFKSLARYHIQEGQAYLHRLTRTPTNKHVNGARPTLLCNITQTAGMPCNQLLAHSTPPMMPGTTHANIHGGENCPHSPRGSLPRQHYAVLPRRPTPQTVNAFQVQQCQLCTTQCTSLAWHARCVERCHHRLQTTSTRCDWRDMQPNHHHFASQSQQHHRCQHAMLGQGTPTPPHARRDSRGPTRAARPRAWPPP
jgi:hypothetical protein